MQTLLAANCFRQALVTLCLAPKHQLVGLADQLSMAHAVLQEYSTVFGGTKNPADPHKPPTMNVAVGDAYPLTLMLRADVQAQATSQAPFRSTRDAHILVRERDALLRDGRAVEATHAIAIASSFVRPGPRVVYSATDANRLLYTSGRRRGAVARTRRVPRHALLQV